MIEIHLGLLILAYLILATGLSYGLHVLIPSSTFGSLAEKSFNFHGSTLVILVVIKALIG